MVALLCLSSWCNHPWLCICLQLYLLLGIGQCILKECVYDCVCDTSFLWVPWMENTMVMLHCNVSKYNICFNNYKIYLV